MQASIIIPTYNRLWCLPEALASCPRGDSIEIIVVDDGSTDGTWDWLCKQSGIVPLRQANWGKPAAVNFGFEQATGRYIRFLDSDDLLVANDVSAQLEQTMAHDADICVAGYRAIYVGDDRIVDHPWIDCGDFVAQQLGECDSSHYSAFWFRRAFIEAVRHRPEFAFRDDRMFVLECAIREPKVSIYSKPTLLHRHHDRKRIQFRTGSVAKVTDWQEREMFQKVASLLRAEGRLTPRRASSMAGNVWALVQRVSAYDRREGKEILGWLRQIDPGFRIPSGGRNRIYRILGYPLAQTLVNAARRVRNAVRSVQPVVRGKVSS